MTIALPPLVIPERFNMARYCLAAQAERLPDKPALVVVDDPAPGTPALETWTFAEMEDAVLRVAAALEDRGLKPGDRILIRLDNTSTYPILYFGAIAAGLIAVATSSQLTAAEADFLMLDSAPRAVALAPHLPRGDIPADMIVLEEADVRAMIQYSRRGTYADTRAEDAAYLLYTSGTTARPKGVVHAHRVALGRSRTYQGWYGIRPDDVMLHAGAFNWTYTLGTGLIDPWANGVTSTIFVGEKTPEVWPAVIRKTGATIFAAVPGLFRQILKYAPPGPLDVRPLRHGLIAGEAPAASLFGDWHARTGTDLYEALGMSEISTYVSTCPGMVRKDGSPGRAQPGRRVAVLPVGGGTEPLPAGEEGLLAVHRSDPGLMLGYWNRADEEAEVYRGEWFLGGDLAVIDADGYIFHQGRANDVMKALGYRVSPLEVETAIAQHADVAEVACAEISPRDGVTVIGAFLVAKPGHTVDAASVLAFAKERLAQYKCPREIIVVDALPRTPNGKVKRSELQKTYRAKGES
ncbi:MAG: AMP-dependent synthetase [Hyphomicrobium sp. 32-62-53]|nr:MAG: AMP-dependent synthetase [Hyphomicrobium sp. 12-62-95]OYX98206.1 MAG: AMP-dependent synthetase [Hyphomicrobium sp. 32-62-53]